MNKITVMFKSPDSVEYAIRDSLNYNDYIFQGIFDENAYESAIEEKIQTIKMWVKWGEQISITFDLDTMTAMVNPVK